MDWILLMLIIVSMERPIEKEPEYGIRWRGYGHPDPSVKKIVVLWMGTGIGKQHREHRAIKKIVGQNTIHCLNKGICIEYLLN